MKYYHDPYTYYVYIMASRKNGTIYTGVTNDIERRAFEHREHIIKKSFTAHYNVSKLVYYEEYNNPNDAISREKQIKSWNRKRKTELIESKNPDWNDYLEMWYPDLVKD